MGLFSIIARLTGDTTDFDRKMTRSMLKTSQTVSNTAGMIKGQLAAAFGVAAIVALEKRTIEFGSKISDWGKRFASTTDKAQELAFAAEQSSTSMESITVALARITKIRADILAGKTAEGAGDILAGLGIGNDQLRESNAVDLLTRIGNILKQFPKSNDRNGMAQILFGETGGQLLPMFDAGLESAANHLRDIGGLIDSEKIQQLKQAGDALNDIKIQMLAIGAEGAPGLVAGLEWGVKKIKLMQQMATDAGAAMIMSIDNGKDVSENLTDIGRANAEASRTDALYKPLIDQYNEEATAVSSLMSLPAIPSVIKASTGSGASYNLSAGSLASIGGFVGLGGSRNATVSISQKQLDKLNEIARLLGDKETITLE
jgi:hypothetical protein